MKKIQLQQHAALAVDDVTGENGWENEPHGRKVVVNTLYIITLESNIYTEAVSPDGFLNWLYIVQSY